MGCLLWIAHSHGGATSIGHDAVETAQTISNPVEDPSSNLIRIPR